MTNVRKARTIKKRVRRMMGEYRKQYKRDRGWHLRWSYEAICYRLG